MMVAALVPPESVPTLHENEVNDSANVMLFPSVPAFTAVTVTSKPLDVAVTPTVPPRAVILAARLVASAVPVPLPTWKLLPVLLAAAVRTSEAVGLVNGLVIVTVPPGCQYL